MPELPEVETIRRGILPFVKGKVFSGLEAKDPRSIKKSTPRQLMEKLSGRRILNVERRAKYLLFSLSPKGWLVIHLGMTGRLLFSPDKYVKVVFQFQGGKKLYFSDARLFGKILYFDEDPKIDLGPDPLAESFTAGHLKMLLRKKKNPIKLVLLDQKSISGIGNIYAAEILFRAGTHPQRKTDTLKEIEIVKLHQKIKEVLREGIKYRGTSDSWYVDARGEKGSFQDRLRVYRREGEPCPKCRKPIKRISLGQRGTYFCPHCQK